MGQLVYHYQNKRQWVNLYIITKIKDFSYLHEKDYSCY